MKHKALKLIDTTYWETECSCGKHTHGLGLEDAVNAHVAHVVTELQKDLNKLQEEAYRVSQLP